MDELADKVNEVCDARGYAASVLCSDADQRATIEAAYERATQAEHDLVAWIEANYERKAVAQ